MILKRKKQWSHKQANSSNYMKNKKYVIFLSKSLKINILWINKDKKTFIMQMNIAAHSIYVI